MNRKRLFILLIPLALIIAACSSADPTPTLVPTAEPVEEPAAAPEEPAAAEQPAEEPAAAEEQAAEESSAEDAAAEEPAVGEEPAMEGGSLTGTIWTVTELNGEPPVPTTNMTAEFNDEGMVSGSAGCNNYSSSYEVDGNQISFGLGMMTQMMCVDVVNAQES